MATIADGSVPDPASSDHDPFSDSPTTPLRPRFALFDQQGLAAGDPDSTPEQAKLTLDAHLADLDRRINDVGLLGTNLVQQRQELADRRAEVEKSGGTLDPDLQQRLRDIEKEYNDVERDTARALLLRPRVPATEGALGSPHFSEGRASRRSLSPTKLESMATGSPSKFSTASRRSRNQAANNHIDDLQFAADISSSLITQTRDLQALLAQREEELRDLRSQESRLQHENESLQQIVRGMDESESKYKDENWNLEMRTHELLATQKEFTDREKKISQSLNAVRAEKTATQRELDDAKLSNAKLVEEHDAAIKRLETDLGTAKRAMATADDDRAALQRQVQDLTDQNTDLAKAFSSHRGRGPEQDATAGAGDGADANRREANVTPEGSPPPSPVKGVTPRHAMLETETLRSSVQHAQRQLQNQRSLLHREKAEKLDLKRQLQETRDELEKLRADASSSSVPPPPRRNRKHDSRSFNKAQGLFGAGRGGSKTEIVHHDDDPEWEDQRVDTTTTAAAAAPSTGAADVPLPSIESDEYMTANETTDAAAFETAHERATETDDFQTGVEDLSDSDDGELTETESPLKKATAARVAASGTSGTSGRSGRPAGLVLARSTTRDSFRSTASTSNDDDDEEHGFGALRTPTFAPSHHKLQTHASRSFPSRAMSRQASEEPAFYQSSPAASFARTNSATATPDRDPGQSLAAELAGLEGGDGDSLRTATPSMAGSRGVTPASQRESSLPPPPVPRLSESPMIARAVSTDTESAWLQMDASVDSAESSATALYQDGSSRKHGSSWPLSVPFLPQPEEDTISQASAHQSTTETETLSFDSPMHSEELVESAQPSKQEQQQQQDTDTIVETDDAIQQSTRAAEPALNDSKQVETVLDSTHTTDHPAKHNHIVAEPVDVAKEPKTMSTATGSTDPANTPGKPGHADTRLPMDTKIPGLATRVGGSGLSMRRPGSTGSLRLPSHPLRILSTNSDVIIGRGVKVHVFKPRDPTLRRPESTGSLRLASLPLSSPLSPHHQAATSGQSSGSPVTSAHAITTDADTAAKPTSLVARKMASTGNLGSSTYNSNNTPTAPDKTAANSSARTHGEEPAELSDAPVLAPAGSAGLADSANSADSALPQQASSENVLPPLAMQQKPVVANNDRGKGVGIEVPDWSEGAVLRSQLSSGSLRLSGNNLPPLPPNHREAINAARTNSAHDSWLMPPPLHPASIIARQRPWTADRTIASTLSLSSLPSASDFKSGRDTMQQQQHHSPMASRSQEPIRQASMSSFKSEIDSRFHLHDDNGNLDLVKLVQAANDSRGSADDHERPEADRRMIKAISHALYGSFVWKYTRKPGGRDDMSEKRHKRYFWLHPLTFTLYWSEDDPGTIKGGRTEGSCKSVVVEAVRVVTDDSVMPPGLHRKSLIVVSRARAVKFTCETGEQHELWFNCLSYLLMRNLGGDGRTGAQDVTGELTRDDVNEFNPAFHRGEARLTVTPSRASSSRAGLGTRISGYFSGTFGRRTLLHSGHYGHHAHAGHPGSASGGSMAGTREAHDSAEDVRQMIVKQDRGASRLENVRACCDGKHDVGTLSHTAHAI